MGYQGQNQIRRFEIETVLRDHANKVSKKLRKHRLLQPPSISHRFQSFLTIFLEPAGILYRPYILFTYSDVIIQI